MNKFEVIILFQADLTNSVLNEQEDSFKNQLSQTNGAIINQEDWANLYETSENIFVKDLMKKWGLHLFPKNYKIR